MIVCVVTVSSVTLAWSWLKKSSLPESFRAVGFGIPNWRAVGIALAISVLMLAFFPIYSSLTGIILPLQSNWLWILLGIVTGTGIAEETLFRGYVFNFFRQIHGFWKAATLSMVLFGTMHLLLLFWLPNPIAIAAILLSVLAAYPMAYLFENGNRTIWPSAILHSTALATSLFVIPAEYAISISLLWIGVLIIGLLLVFIAGRIILGKTTTGELQMESKAL
jgi:membrane protease YdiL (CAAX protease family)